MPHTFGIVGIPLRGRGPYEKPSPSARINPQHPLAQGLLHYFLLREGSGGVAVDSGPLGLHGVITIGSGSWGMSPYGQSINASATNVAVPLDDRQNSANVTVTALCLSSSTTHSSIGRGILTKTNSAGNAGYGIRHVGTAWPIDVRMHINAYSSNYASVGGVGENKWHMVSGTYDGVNCRAYLDGIAGSVAADGGPITDPSADIELCRTFNSSTYSMLGAIGLGAVHSRALNPTEIAQLHWSPYQMFWEPGRRAIFVPLAEEPGGTLYERSLSDGISLGDSVVRAVTWARGLTDGMELGEILSRTVAWNRSLTDGLVLGDSAGRTAACVRALTELMALGDEASRTTAYARALTEPMVLGDSLAATAAFLAVLSDAIALGDSSAAVAAFARTLTDAIALGDNTSGTLVLFRALSDAIAVTDEATTAGAFIRALTDAVSLADSVSRTVTFYRLLSDTLELSDVRTVALGDRRQQFSATFSAGGPATSSFSAGGPATSSFSAGGPAGA